MDDKDVTLYVAIASCLAAVVAAIAAWLSASYAKETAKLAQKQANEERSPIEIYLIESLCWNNEDGAEVVAFACTFTNTAKAANSVSRLNLHVTAFEITGTQIEILLEPTTAHKTNAVDFKPIEMPINLAPRSTSSGWITFVIPASVRNRKIIDRYQIRAFSAAGDLSTADAYLIKRVVNV